MSQTPKIFPRNLTARAAHQVAGNPDISRPEDVVANCFPGLDMDLRNLDRRFFPGLVFEFVSGLSDTDPWQGARLLYCDALGDEDLQPAYLDQLDQAPLDYQREFGGGFGEFRETVRELQRPLLAELSGNIASDLNSGDVELTPALTGEQRLTRQETSAWFLDWIKQGERHIDLYGVTVNGAYYPLDGDQGVWRLVRSLRPGRVEIGLRRRHAGEDLSQHPQPGDSYSFSGWRRLYTSPLTGVLSRAYQPGELTMSMCSPWQHDFRDCACHYWASNRPDVVYGEVAPDEHMLPGGASANPVRATTRLDWMRADCTLAAPALSTMFANRPFQMDHFQISQDWQKLNMVLRNTEIGEEYVPPPPDQGRPYGSPRELYAALRDDLAGLEMTLALEYLYAGFSLIGGPGEVVGDWPNAAEDAALARHYLRLTAVSEMQHLRWVNELMWSLRATYFSHEPFVPVLTPSKTVPVPVAGQIAGRRERALRALTPDVLAQFIAVEQPSGGIDGLYSKVVATLAQPGYPPQLHELASRIANDGTEHFSRLAALAKRLELYGEDTPYLRSPFVLAAANDTKLQTAAGLYKRLLGGLAEAYALMGAGNFARAGGAIEATRGAMNGLLLQGDELARSGIGIPFWDLP